MDDPDNRRNYILVLLSTIIFAVIYTIYFFIILTYIISFYKTKKLSVLWISYLSTFILYVVFMLIYLIYLFYSKGEDIIFFNKDHNSYFTIIIATFLAVLVFNTINNLIYNLIISLRIIISLNKMKKIKSLDFQELFFKLKEISTNFFNKIFTVLLYLLFCLADIGLAIGFVYEYTNYGNGSLFKHNLLRSIRYCYEIVLLIQIIFIFILNYFKNKIVNKCYYNCEQLSKKIYDMIRQKLLYASYIITFKDLVDLIINSPVLVFLIFKVNHTLFFFMVQILIFIYILIFGALILKIDKLNEIGKMPKVIKMWFFLKKTHFCFNDKFYQHCLYDSTYKYSKDEKLMVKNLDLIEIEEETERIKDNNELVINNTFSSSVIRDKIVNMDLIDIRETQSIELKRKLLNFNTVSELYVLYKLLMLYFEKNESIYSKVQNQIYEEGTPFKQFYKQQNLTKNKKIKARQTFGGFEAAAKKKDFMDNIDRMSRISKLNSSKITSSMNFSDSKIFFSLEEKELREEFKAKFNNEKDATFKIESLSSNSFFELFPFYQISIQDIKKSLYPSDNTKIHKIIIKQKNEKKENVRGNNIESESEDNLFYTFNSLLMMEIYDREEFISFNDFSNFVLSYGNFILDTIKNISVTYMPLILGVFNIEICDESKVVILYRNPLYFTNFNHFNHWINFYITEGPERIKASIFQNEVLDINEIEIKNCLKMNETDYEEIINNLKRDFDFFMKIPSQVYPIIHLFIGDENDENIIANNNMNESSLIENTSNQHINISGLLNITEDETTNNKILRNSIDSESNYKTEINSLVDKEYYSQNGHDIHNIKIYFTHFFRLNCELNKQKNIDDNILLKSNHYCQYLEGQIQTYLTKTNLFEMETIENIDNN